MSGTEAAPVFSWPWLKIQIRQGFRYLTGAVGGLAVDWLTWTAVFMITGNLIFAQGCGKMAGGTTGFFTYRHFVFKAHQAPPHGQAFRFILAAVCSGIISIGLVYSFSRFAPPVFAKIGADGITFMINYEVMRSFVFRKRIA